LKRTHNSRNKRIRSSYEWVNERFPIFL
jgi:hypothetical protein